jgi:hypothetical protein
VISGSSVAAAEPSAVVVLLGGIALGQAWFGILLVLAYGIGMAATSPAWACSWPSCAAASTGAC